MGRSNSADVVDSEMYVINRSISLNAMHTENGEFSDDDFQMGLAAAAQMSAEEILPNEKKTAARVRAGPSRKAKTKKLVIIEEDYGDHDYEPGHANSGSDARAIRSRRKLRENTPYIDVE